MIAYLQGLKYKYTDKDTLNDREFTLVSESSSVNYELTTLGNTVTQTTQVFDLFMATKFFTIAKVQGILNGANDNGDIILDATADVEKQERGYLITLTFIKKD